MEMKPRNLAIVFLLIYGFSFIYFVYRSLSLDFNGELITLLPAKNNHLASYKNLQRLNSSEGGFNLIISSEDQKTVIKRASEINEDLLRLAVDGEYIFRTAEMENDLYDIRKSALYLMTLNELDSLFIRTNEYVRDKKREANPLYVDLEEDESEVKPGSDSSVLLEAITESKRYNINEDSTVISILYLPNFPKSDFNRLEMVYDVLLKEKSDIEANYPGLNVYWGGSYINYFNKINDVQFSVLRSLIIGILSVLLFLIGYMIYINRGFVYKARYILLDLALMFFILFSGFVITLGISSFLVDEINVFTGIVFSILFGINLDYILHLYSVNKQHTIDRSGIVSILRHYISSTRPILLSCLTTGLAIMSLIFAEFNGFIQFGAIFFISVLVNLVSTYIFLLFSPSASEHVEETDKGSGSRIIGNMLSAIVRNEKRTGRLAILPGILIMLAIGSYFGMQSLSFNFSFSDLEPKSAASTYNEARSRLSSGANYHEPAFYIGDTIEEAKVLYEEIRSGLDSKYPGIERVESFAARYPLDERELMQKASKIDSIRTLLDSNTQYFENMSTEAAELVDIARNTEAPTIEGLPKYIRNRYFFKNGTIAPMVMIYPAMSLANGQTSIQFRKDYGEITVKTGKTYYGASTSMIASSVLELLIQESQFLFVVPLGTIILLLFLYYRSVIKTVIAVLPLILTFAMLLSFRTIWSLDLNLYNVVVFPIIIGVGADNGIHLVDSLIQERSSFLRYFITERFPVLVACSVTTILGFVGLLFVNHPGMQSLGILATAGIAVTLIATFFTSLLVDSYYLKN